MLNKSKLFAGVLLLVAFLVGGVVGGAVSVAWGERDGRDGRRDHRHRGYVERLQEDLGLTAAQRDSVKAILDRREREMRALWEEIAPRFDSLRSRIRGEIMAVLNEDQRARFGELIARSDSMRHGNRKERRHDR